MLNIKSPKLIHLTTGSLDPLFEQYPFTQQSVLLSCGLGVDFAEKTPLLPQESPGDCTQP